MHNPLFKGVAVLGLATALCGPVSADVTLEIMHSYGSHRDRIHQPVADAFMALNPDVTIEFRAPAQNYDEGHLTIIRDALTNRTPDIWYSGHHLTGELVERLREQGTIAPMTRFLEAEGEDWVAANYTDTVLKLGQIDGVQWGMPFNASTPIVYYNLDLVERAGWDLGQLPSDWNEIIELAGAINALGDDIDGAVVNLSLDGDWIWQAMVMSHGGQMMNASRNEVAFNGDAGMEALRVVQRLVDETDMPLLNEEQGIQQFIAGNLGMFFGSTAEVRIMGDSVGDTFAWGTSGFPLGDAENGTLPTGGNSAVILAQDPDVQQAAWDFIRFATGPEGQRITVLGSGYMPTNIQTEGSEYLGAFYAENPDWTTSVRQWPLAVSWFGYPGASSVRVWREQHNVIYAVARGEIDVETGMEQLVERTLGAIETQ